MNFTTTIFSFLLASGLLAYSVAIAADPAPFKTVKEFDTVNIQEKLQQVQEHLSCVQAAPDRAALKVCHETARALDLDLTKRPIPHLIEQNVTLTNGIDFDSGKLVSTDSFTGEEIIPCNSKRPFDAALEKKPSKLTVNGCKSPVLLGDESLNNIALQDALKSSGQPIIGTVSINGEEREARFVVTVTALYKGSHCTTTYAAGTERTNCINKEKYCAALRALKKNPNYPC